MKGAEVPLPLGSGAHSRVGDKAMDTPFHTPPR